MCNILIFPLSRIVLYCSNKYCNISIYCNIVSSLACALPGPPLAMPLAEHKANLKENHKLCRDVVVSSGYFYQPLLIFSSYNNITNISAILPMCLLTLEIYVVSYFSWQEPPLHNHFYGILHYQLVY